MANTRMKRMPSTVDDEAITRMTVSLSQANYDYLAAMAPFRGMTISRFLNHVIERDRAAGQSVYDRLRGLQAEVESTQEKVAE